MPAARGISGMWSNIIMINRGYQYNIFFEVLKDEENTVKQGVEVSKLSRINDLTYRPRIILCDDRYPITGELDPEFLI